MIKTLLISLVIAANVAPSTLAQDAAPVFHSPDNPKLKLYTGADVEGINSWWEAKHFCESKGRLLATRDEWCSGNWGKWTAEDVYGGVKPDEQWAPLRGSHANSWVQIGHLDGNTDSACKQYDELYEVSDGLEGVEEEIDDTVYCAKPDGCTGDECPLPNLFAKGYYPDPTDCTAYCYYSGADTGSYWTKKTDDGKVWDPWCGNSDPLNRRNQPLAGMTGGCMNPKHYVDDNSYCTPAAARRRLERKKWDKPEWGLDKLPHASENNYILCTKLSEEPVFPQTCAAVYGDPHIISYDGLTYDNQGAGDFILQRSLHSNMEIQGRFLHFSDKQASVTRGVYMDTGRDSEPTIEVTFTNRCWLRFWVDGQEMKLSRDWITHGTYAAQTSAVQYHKQWSPRATDHWLWFPGSGMSLHVRQKKSTSMGCYMNVRVCLPDDIASQETLVGLLGSPNGDKGDDFMTRDGTNLDHQGNTEWEYGYNYSHENWCIRDQAENRFATDEAYTCDTPYDPEIENAVKNAPAELKEICGSDIACLTDGIAGGVEDSQDNAEEVRALEVEDVVEIDPKVEEKTEEEASKEESANEAEACKSDLECPQPRCAVGFPCPSYVCQGGECIAEYPETPAPRAGESTPASKGSGSGDPHFKTWTGDKFDYHGECDLVLVDNPSFANGLGLKLHIRTTRVKYFSYIERAALQIGNDVLEFENDIEKTLLNGEVLPPNVKHHKNLLSGQFEIRRDRKAISVRLDKDSKAKIDFLSRKNGFLAVVVDTGSSNSDALFEGSLGLLGQWGSGKRIARDGQTEMNDPDATAYALEWQVRDTEPMLFQEARFPQYPSTCLPPKKTLLGRLGAKFMEQEAAKACEHWQEDKEDCIFDVMATRDVEVAAEGQILHVEYE